MLLSKDRTRSYLLSVIGVILLLALGAFAAETNVVASGSNQGLYSVDASGTDVRNVLEALARQSGANVIISPDVAGTITAHLKQMPIESLMDFLATAHGFDWTKKGDTFVVSAKDKTAKPEVAAPPPAPEYDTLIWRCRHVKANELVTLLTGLFPDCKIAAGPSGVSPVLQDALSGASEATGASTTSSAGSASSSTSSDDKSPGIVMYGQAKDIARAKDLLQKLDVPRPQIAIEVAVTEISSSLNKELGINWSWNDVTLKETGADGIKFGNLAKQPMTFTGTLAALTTDGSAHLLAQPNISVIDGGYADILIGDRILFPKLVGYTQFGTPMYDKEEVRVGIYLQIAPKVTEDDEVVLTLYPQVSLVTSYLKTQAGDYPQISTREARTTVSVKSGATLAIGGLIRDNEIKNAQKIPLLGDLPIIGQFFRHNKTTKDRSEIVIFLTPKIIPTGSSPATTQTALATDGKQ